MEGAYEHPSSSLGHSEELSVENPVGPPVPELAQAIKECPKVSALMTGEESRNILEEDGGRSVPLHKVKEGEGEAAALSGEPGSLAGDGEVLAGEAAGPENSAAGTRLCESDCACSVRFIVLVGSLPCCQSNDVTEVRDSGPSLGEDGAGVGVDLAEADGSPAGTFKPKVKSADA